MVRILLVDDEPLVRDALKELINWEKYDFVIAAEAFDGVTALEELKRKQIDIVLTDIKMPVMDGLQLINKIQELYKDIRCVVLSAYDEFNLVRKAYAEGAKDYILKSEIDEEHVIEVLKKVAKELLKDREEKLKIEEQNRHIKLEVGRKILLGDVFTENEILLKEKLLKDLIWGEVLNKVEYQVAQNLGLRLASKNLCVMLIKIDIYMKLSKDNIKNKGDNLKFSILVTINEILNKYNLGDSFSNNNVQ